MTDYDTDFVAWCQDQADRLRRLEGTPAAEGLDISNLADEIEDLAKLERREAKQAAEEVVATTLALVHADGLPETLIDHWHSRMGWAIRWIDMTIDDAPSVRQHLESKIDRINESGRNLAELLYYRAGVDPPAMAEPRFTLDELLTSCGV